jgi:hypothetical protein
VDHRRPQVPLRAVVGRLDIAAGQANEELVSVAAAPFVELPGLARSERRPEDEVVGSALDQDAPAGERLGPDLSPLAVQTERSGEDVPQLTCSALTTDRVVHLGRIGEVADLVAQAERVLGGRSPELARESIRASHRRANTTEEPVNHFGCATSS